VNGTSGGRSDTESCWQVVDQIFADHPFHPTRVHVVLQSLVT